MSLFFSILMLLVAIILIVFGVYNGRHIFKKNDKKRVVSQNEQDKNNIPVVPRHLRNLDSTDTSTASTAGDSTRRKPRKSKADIFVKPTSVSPNFNDVPADQTPNTNQTNNRQPLSNETDDLNELNDLDDLNDLNAFDDFADDVDISSLVIDDFDVSQDKQSHVASNEVSKTQAQPQQVKQKANAVADDDFMAEMDDFFDDSDDIAGINGDFDALFDDNTQPSTTKPVTTTNTATEPDNTGLNNFDDALLDSIDDFEDSLDDLSDDFDDDLDDIDISNLVIGEDDQLPTEKVDNKIDDGDDWLSDDLDDASSPVVDIEHDTNEVTEAARMTDDVDITTEENIQATETEETDAFYNLAFATERLMPTVKTVDEPEFTENSPVLDQHLLAHADFDQNSPLKQADDNLNITIIPLNEFSRISGKKLLKLVDDFGFKFGAMSMFHRYQNKDGSGVLWFSMMGLSKDGVVPFDLNTLPETTELKGLVMFLPLPHPKLLQGFDSMMSIAGLIARELEAFLVDEEGEPITREYKIQLRSHLQALETDLMAVSGF